MGPKFESESVLIIVYTGVNLAAILREFSINHSGRYFFKNWPCLKSEIFLIMVKSLICSINCVEATAADGLEFHFLAFK